MATRSRRFEPLGSRVEVANGNGVRHAAKRAGDQLQQKGVKVVSVTNAPDFDVTRSTIYFRDGHMRDALALSRTLAVRPAIMLSSKMHREAQIRLVLGKDVADTVVMEDGPVVVANEMPNLAALR